MLMTIAIVLTGTVSHDFHKALAQDTVENLPDVKSVHNRLKVSDENMAGLADKRLAHKVKTELGFHRSVNARATEVTANDGTVTLEGVATSSAQKELTEEYVRDVEGVKTVKNEMTVTEAPTGPERTIAEKIDDASITAQIKTSLLAHISTSALKTGLETRNGVVTVSGVASNPAEKTLVTKLINDIHGVLSVVNNMTVKEASSTKN